jgi:uncharacterized protein
VAPSADTSSGEAPSRPVAVVTGGSSGIGLALSRRLASRGWQCVLIARGRERLERAAAEIGAQAEPCDVGDPDAVEAVAASVRARHPRIRLLVNSAGIPGRTTFAEGDRERIESLVRTNYLGSVWCLRAFLPALEAGRPAEVVNVVSVAGVVVAPASGPYCAAKHAQLAFSRATAAELRGRGIRVRTVNPGFVHTEGFPNRGRLPGPLNRLVIEADAVAAHIVSLLGGSRTETYVPGWYRAAAIAQSLAPGLVTRALARREAATPSGRER